MRLEIRQENGDVVHAMTRGTNGRYSSATALRPLSGDVSHIRVIGREERTNAEQAQYRFLLSSLTVARPVPLFVNIVWFPENTQATERNGEINLSCGPLFQVLNILNDSQREIVRAMVSGTPQHSLVIAHGMHILRQRSFLHPDADVISQVLLELEKPPQLPQQPQYGYPLNYHAG
jgi:hypothetical protein